MLKCLKQNPPYGLLRERADYLREQMTRIASESGVDYKVNGTTGMFTGFFSGKEVWDYETASGSDRAVYEKFFKGMLEEGIFFAPSPFEAAFITLAHGEEELGRTLGACEKVFKNLKE